MQKLFISAVPGHIHFHFFLTADHILASLSFSMQAVTNIRIQVCDLNDDATACPPRWALASHELWQFKNLKVKSFSHSAKIINFKQIPFKVQGSICIESA